MNFTKYRVPGLTRDLWLPSHLTLIVKLIPAQQTLNRPGYKLWTHKPVWIAHETGNYNPGAGPLSQVNYVLGGAKDRYGNPQQVSFHLTGDHLTIYLLIPVDEVTYQAACGGCGGNYNAISYEQCVNPETPQAAARDTHEWVAAGFLEAMDTPPTGGNITKHYDWNEGDPDRHHCPDLMLNDNYWNTFENRVTAKWTQVRNHRITMELPPVVIPPVPIYPKVTLPTWFDRNEANGWPTDQTFDGATAYVLQRNIRCIAEKGTNPLTYPSSLSAGAKVAGAKILLGNKKHILRMWKSPVDKKMYALTEDGFWLLASKFTPYITIEPR